MFLVVHHSNELIIKGAIVNKRLSFGYFKIHDNNIVEIIVDQGIKMSLEMVEECHEFIRQCRLDDFALLINRVNQYDYSFEAKLSVASHENVKAIAFVYYHENCKTLTESLIALRAHDGWNTRLFHGLELGWQQALTWLKQELAVEV